MPKCPEGYYCKRSIVVNMFWSQWIVYGFSWQWKVITSNFFDSAGRHWEIGQHKNQPHLAVHVRFACTPNSPNPTVNQPQVHLSSRTPNLQTIRDKGIEAKGIVVSYIPTSSFRSAQISWTHLWLWRRHYIQRLLWKLNQGINNKYALTCLKSIFCCTTNWASSLLQCGHQILPPLKLYQHTNSITLRD